MFLKGLGLSTNPQITGKILSLQGYEETQHVRVLGIRAHDNPYVAG